MNDKVTRQRRKKENTHKAIMHSAKKLFEDTGLNNVTIEEITESADVSRSTFFSHFASLDALVTEIAGVAIEDILNEHRLSEDRGLKGIATLFSKLVDDTCPYPHLSAELFINGILKSRGKSPYYYFEHLIINELLTDSVSEEKFKLKEQAALIMGAYFGTVFQKLINGETFDKPEELKITINKFIINITGGTI